MDVEYVLNIVDRITTKFFIFKVFLIGFSTQVKEKLIKILNLSGATRYDDINERITHIVVGDRNNQDFKQIDSNKLIPIVTSKWLLDCVDQMKLVPVGDYTINLSTSNGSKISSPLCVQV